MKKFLFIMTLTLTFVLALAGCSSKQAISTSSSHSSPNLKDTETEFRKALVPVKYQEEETVEDLYYKTVFSGDEAFYEVQPDGEDEPLRIPVSETVIYGIDEGENYIEKVTFKLDDGTEVSQYQINARLESVTVYDVPSENGKEEVPGELAGTEDVSLADETGNIAPAEDKMPEDIQVVVLNGSGTVSIPAAKE